MGASSTNKTPKRYRINPLELLIFSLVSAGFGYSVYHLFRETNDLQFATLQPMQTQPNREVPSRSIAGVPSGPAIDAVVDGAAPVPQRLRFEVNCAENPGFQLGDQQCPNVPVKGRALSDTPRHNPGSIR